MSYYNYSVLLVNQDNISKGISPGFKKNSKCFWESIQHSLRIKNVCLNTLLKFFNIKFIMHLAFSALAIRKHQKKAFISLVKSGSEAQGNEGGALSSKSLKFSDLKFIPKIKSLC